MICRFEIRETIWANIKNGAMEKSLNKSIRLPQVFVRNAIFEVRTVLVKQMMQRRNHRSNGHDCGLPKIFSNVPNQGEADYTHQIGMVTHKKIL